MGEVEEAVFRERLSGHMESTEREMKAIRSDVRRQADSTETLRAVVADGFAEVSDRVTRVEAANDAQRQRCDDHVGTEPPGKGVTAVVGGGSALTMYGVLEALGRFFRNGGSTQ